MKQIDKEKIFNIIMENMWDLAHVWDIKENKFIYFSPAVERIHGYTQEEVLNLHWTDLIAPESLQEHIKYTGARYIQAAQKIDALNDSSAPQFNEYIGLRKDGSRIWLEQNISYFCEEGGKPTHSIGISRDISARKEMEEQLKHAHDQMEEMVRDQTAQLKELNTTVNVLLDQRESFKKSYRKDLSSFIAGLVKPYIDKLKNSRLNKHQLALVERIEFSLNDAVTPIARKLTSGLSALSPTDLQIALLIKDGKSTKEIASTMNLSTKTIEFHREKIRDKLGIKNKKVNLRSLLANMD
jgi:PAS domain S-box-containing protein